MKEEIEKILDDELEIEKEFNIILYKEVATSKIISLFETKIDKCYNRIEDICEYNSVDYNACAKTELIMDILRFSIKD